MNTIEKGQRQVHLVMKNSLFLFIARIFEFIYGFVALKLLTTYLGIENFGSYNYLLAIISVIIPLTYSGLQRVLIREISTHKQDFPKYFGAALVVRGFFSIVTFIIIQLVAYLWTSLPVELRLVLAILSIADLLFAFFFLMKTVFIAFEEMKYEDMSAILNTSVGALKASYHHAMKKIEQYLTED